MLKSLIYLPKNLHQKKTSKLLFVIFRLIKMNFSLNKVLNDRNKELITPEALDLLYKMLEVDHSQRITAKEALQHPYLNIKENNNNNRKEFIDKKNKSKN